MLRLPPWSMPAYAGGNRGRIGPPLRLGAQRADRVAPHFSFTDLHVSSSFEFRAGRGRRPARRLG
ncbi:hypothetical protein ABW38_27580, partial [Achromobacter xylosoxidans]